MKFEEPYIIPGAVYNDERGVVVFNNDFNSEKIKRIYFIENRDTFFVRGWQGHKLESRWFAAVSGGFFITLIKVDNWVHPSRNLEGQTFELYSEIFDVLYCPPGYISAIRCNDPGARLMAMSDYEKGAVDDEWRFDINYFE